MKMKKLGLVGGISWVSTLDYYRYLNEGIHARRGGLEFAECLLYSLNFGDIQAVEWPNSFPLLLGACESLVRGGAGCTEVPLLLGPADLPVPVFDTAKIHCQAAIDFALGQELDRK